MKNKLQFTRLSPQIPEEIQVVEITSLLRETLEPYLMVNIPKTLGDLKEAAQRLETTRINNVPVVRPQAPPAQVNEYSRQQRSSRQSS